MGKIIREFRNILALIRAYIDGVDETPYAASLLVEAFLRF
jgi:hypothetical protein